MSSSEISRNNLHSQAGELRNVEQVVLKPCHICGRTFNPQSLERHEKVCEKTQKVIRRNIFNSFSQRAKDIGAVPTLTDVKEEDKTKSRKSKEHESISHMKGEKNSTSNVMNNGLKQLKKTPSGYQQCPSCNRCFNNKAADRHIVWCMEQQSRLPKTPPSSQALERLKARVKYQAPLPKRKDSNLRLVKSAESIREPFVMRTHSSPPIPIRDMKTPKKQSGENSTISVLKAQKQKMIDESLPICPNNNSSPVLGCLNDSSELQSKKAVKFKEIFPVYKKERNKNLDMLAALKLRLSELETSEDFLDDSFIKPSENELQRNLTKRCNFIAPTHISREIWTSDGEVHCTTSSSSDGSLPSVSRAENSEQRMPRFCYNCGTKYPIVSAKFCCECGARRFVFGANNNHLYA